MEDAKRAELAKVLDLAKLLIRCLCFLRLPPSGRSRPDRCVECASHHRQRRQRIGECATPHTSVGPQPQPAGDRFNAFVIMIHV